MKIAVIGYSGSGKSTLAKFLGEKYDIPVLHFDRIHWLPGWNERTREEKRSITRAFMDENPQWVIDGNYFAIESARRMEEADKIIFLSFNRISCLFRAFKRYIKYRGKTREDMGDGCDEKFDAQFAWWILHEGRSGKTKEKYRNILKRYPDKVVVIKNQKGLDEFMKKP